MSDALEPAALTDQQRTQFLAAIAADKTIGNVAALRQAGVPGTKRDLKALVDDDLEHEARLARGWNLNRVEAVAWEVAVDPDHPSWDRANARILKAYHPAFRDTQRIEHTGSLDVDSHELADAVDRFTALADAAVRAAARARTDPSLADAAAGNESPARVPVAQLAGPADPASP